MAHSEYYRVAVLLLILQAWLIPCDGFASVPQFGRALWLPHVVTASGTARSFSLPSTGLSTRGATALFKGRSRGPSPCSRLRMSDGGDTYDPEGAILGGSEGPGPYRDEHDSGASRFRDLLARAKKVDPTVEERLNLRPQPYAPTPQSDAQPQPRRPLPPRPKNPPNYDNLDEWDRIGSPALPDLPLRNEMPGLQIPGEMGNVNPRGTDTEADDGSSAGGSRFRNLMNQARNNREREQMGGLPRASARSAGGGPPAAPRETFTKEEKARAVRAAVERQQKLMAKAKGIDLDDPSLDGPELQRMRAISRAQAEATGGGYVPSSSASDDYFDQLKKDSKSKIKRLQAELEGLALPEEEGEISTMPTAEEVRGERAPEFAPQRRRKASLSIQNESDAYIAALSGIKVDLKKNPYLKQSTTDFIETDDDSPAAIKRKIFRPPSLPPPRPTGPTISYAERLKKARNAEELEANSRSPTSAAAVQPPVPAHAQPPATLQAAAAVSYAERLKHAQVVTTSTGGSDVVNVAARPQPSAPAPSPVPIQNRADAVAPQTRLIDQQLTGDPFSDDDGGPETKMMHVMDLLTEHKTTGLRSEAHVTELRNALVDAMEALRMETYGGSPPSPITRAAATLPVAAPREPVVAPPAGALPALAQSTQQAAAASGNDKETLRRCSALLAAHVHSSLSGNDIMVLREALIASLTILEHQIDHGALFEDAWSVSRDSAAPSRSDAESPRGTESNAEPVPASLGGIQSVGAILSDMGVGKKPAKFEPETDSPPTAAGLKGAPAGDGQGKRWTDGSLGAFEKGVATKGLGYLLKHRGGKGYGRGRVKGLEAEDMVAILAELTEILHDEMVEV